MTWVAAGVASASATMAGIQYFQAKKQAKKDAANRPKLDIPVESYKNLSQAEHMALQGMPEEVQQRHLSNLQQSASFTLGQSKNRKSGLVGVAQINESLNRGYQNLAADNSLVRIQNQQQLYGMRNNIADYKMQQFQINQSNPYYEGIARRNANIGALFQNLSNSGQIAAGGMGGGMGGQKQQQAPNQYGTYGQGQNYYGYNPQSNPRGMVQDGENFGGQMGYTV